MDAIQSQILNLARLSPKMAEDPMGFMREIIGPTALQQLNSGISVCNDCAVKCRTRTIGTGPHDAQLMVIMDYPSAEQAKLDRSISVFGGAPRLEEFLRRCFASFSVDFEQIFFMNTVCCCPSRTVEKATGTEELYRTPNKSEIVACSTFMRYAIDIVHPPMIILMGAVASNVFEKNPINKARGKWLLPYGIPAMVTYGPNELLYLLGQISEEQRLQMQSDFKADIGNALTMYRRQWPDNKLFTR